MLTQKTSKEKTLKKILSIVLAMLVCLSLTFALTGCDKENSSSSQEVSSSSQEVEYVIPYGYKEYVYWQGELSFAIPSMWYAEDSAFVTIIMGVNGLFGSNNITITKEPITMEYKNLTNENFAEKLGDPLQSQGIYATNPRVEQKNNGAEDITVIQYDAGSNGVSFKQYIYAVNSSIATYNIVITLETSDDELLQNVYDSIRIDEIS